MHKQFNPNKVAELVPKWLDLEMDHAIKKHKDMGREPKAVSVVANGLDVDGEARADVFNYYSRVIFADRLIPREGNIMLTQASGKSLVVSLVIASALAQERVTSNYGFVEGYRAEIKPLIGKLLPHFDEIPNQDLSSEELDKRLSDVAAQLTEYDSHTAELGVRELIKDQAVMYVGHVASAGVWAQPGLPSGELLPWREANGI